MSDLEIRTTMLVKCSWCETYSHAGQPHQHADDCPCANPDPQLAAELDRWIWARINGPRWTPPQPYNFRVENPLNDLRRDQAIEGVVLNRETVSQPKRPKAAISSPGELDGQSQD